MRSLTSECSLFHCSAPRQTMNEGRRANPIQSVPSHVARRADEGEESEGSGQIRTTQNHDDDDEQHHLPTSLAAHTLHAHPHNVVQHHPRPPRVTQDFPRARWCRLDRALCTTMSQNHPHLLFRERSLKGCTRVDRRSPWNAWWGS